MKICIGISMGRGKIECEDSAFCDEMVFDTGIHEVDADAIRCLGVADGVGGNAGGRLASYFVAQKLTQTDFSSMTQEDIRLFMTELNNELLQYASTFQDQSGMATTLSALIVAEDGVYLLHGGNTRLYMTQGDYLKQLTSDHTTYCRLREMGEYEAAERCSKSEIFCCLGGGDPRFSDSFVIRKVFEEGVPHRLMLTSDGIHDYVDIDTMEAILASGDQDRFLAEALLNTALKNGSGDDMTVIIITNS